MKKTSLFLLTAMGLLAGLSSADAQFLKNVLNSVKNTAQGRANDKADQTTNKTIDKVDGSGSKPSAVPDTSQAGMMKMLGVMTGGAGVSAADSAAAIKTYMKGSGRSGYSYQYVMTATSKKNGTAKDTSYKWLTNGGEGRSEMRILMPGVASGKIMVIGRAGQPQYSILLSPDDKSYSLAVIDTSLINAGHSSYEVTKVGNETVDGFACVHVKMKSTTGSGLFKSSSTEDLWTSTDVPGYALYKSLSDASLRPGMIQSLEKAGAGGFLVKMSASGKDYSMDMELIHAQSGSFSASLFTIPSGYVQTNKTMMEYMLSGAKQPSSK